MKKRVLLSVALSCAAFAAAADDARYELRGLEKPAEIIVDEWGVPHIYAGTHYDAFFVQGFNAARDRLWQIDTWRRRGLGQLAAVFGEEYLEQDRATRLFLYRGDMYREWLAYGSDAKRIAEAFTAGINAYVELVERQPALLPPEFGLLDYRPALWSPEDVVIIRGHGLWGNVSREVQRAMIVCAADLETASYWQPLEPQWSTTVPDGLDPCIVPPEALDVYFLAKAPVRFGSRLQSMRVARSEATDRDIGSNNWVVAPRRTTTGRPILADDPHRTHAVPSLRYVTHLVAPGLDVIGAGEPALPGISIGHNDRIAFGLTIFPIDQEDLYVYAKEVDGYRVDDAAEPFHKIVEHIPVRGGEPVTVELKFTRHGPVVYETDQHVFAIRAAWLEPGMAPYFGSVEYMRASNWREFLAALNRWGAPSENQVYADTDGNIGYKPAGLFPRRSGWDGLLPVPGDGRYEWNGFFDMDVLPVEFNPGRGFTGTANSMNLPAEYDIGRYPMGFEWNAGWRYRRLWQVLEADDAHSTGESEALQRDYLSLMALEAVQRIPSEFDDPGTTLLRRWDGTMSADSAEAAFFTIWYHRHLVPALAQLLLPAAPHLVADMDSRGALKLLAEPRAHAVIGSSIRSAYAEAQAMLGNDTANWRWGDLHQIRFTHPLLQLAEEPLASQMEYEPFPRGGSGNTVNNTGFGSADFLVRSGASYRQVIDVGNWDASSMTNAPGQSGDPRSPFYDNLLEGWATEQSFPLLYSRDRVLQHEVMRIELLPAEAQPGGE